MTEFLGCAFHVGVDATTLIQTEAKRYDDDDDDMIKIIIT